MKAQVIREIYPSQTIQRKRPVNVSATDEHLFGDKTQFLAKTQLLAFKNTCVSDLGIIFKNLSVFKDNITCYELDFKNYQFKYLLNTLLKGNQITNNSQKFLIAFDNYSGPAGFFHWIADGLTKLIEIKDELKDYTLVFPWYFEKESVYKETLHYFDINQKLFLPPQSYLKAAFLYAMTPIAPTGDFRSENLAKLRAFYWDHCKAFNTSEREKIYISRKKAKRRFVTNDDEVIAVCKSRNIRIVYMEELSFCEQVRLAFNADVLISIHGAALTHIMFMQPGTKVLELRKQDDAANNVYLNLANASEVNYYYQLCPATLIKDVANNFNLTVNIKNFTEVIDRILSE